MTMVILRARRPQQAIGGIEGEIRLAAGGGLVDNVRDAMR
jgi:hypothetical protein